VKKAVAVTFIMVLSFFVADGLQIVNFAKANPYPDKFVTEGEVSPPEGTLPPTISILSPQNNTKYASNNISLTFNVNIPKLNNGTLWIAEVYYKTSWHSSNIHVKKSSDYESRYSQTFSINLTDVAEGPRWIEVYAVGQGGYVTREVCRSIFSTIYQVFFKITRSAMVNFNIDTTPPKVSITSIANETYNTSTVPLDFVTNEHISQATYSIDGQDNVTITGNTTLSGLASGKHNLIIYAKDEAGNTGASKTTWFNVTEPFPTTLVAAVSATMIATISIVLIVYFKKRKR
jgi:hypothetical protein